MVIVPSRKLVFLHVPRTAGTSISSAIAEAIPDAEWIVGPRQHRGARYVAEHWPDYRTIAVLRDPHKLYASYYRWVQINKQHIQYLHEHCERSLAEHLQNMSLLSFGEVVQQACDLRILCYPGGFRETYCADDTIVVRYGEGMWGELESVLGVGLREQHQNVTGHEEVAWTAAGRDLVRRYCFLDYR